MSEIVPIFHRQAQLRTCLCLICIPNSDGSMLEAVTISFDAIYENGKLVLQRPLPLPEHSHVRVTIEPDVEREAWMKLSEESLTKIWDNDADDVFNDLLQK